MSENNPEVALATLSEQLTKDAIVSWSDDRRKDFINTFDNRVRVSQYILTQTAANILATAEKRQFISSKHRGTVEIPATWHYDGRGDNQSYSYSNHSNRIGGRDNTELNKIAEERSENILNSLPPLKKAVQLINPAIAKLIEERDQLIKDGNELMAEAAELSGPLDMDDFPQTMTLKEFRDQVEAREQARENILKKLDKMGKKGEELEKQINKFLYSGLPGLSDAVIKVAQNNIDRAVALSGMLRRVSEQVQFGDSAAALEILASFEKDESTVSEEIQAQFDAALEILKAVGQGKPKKLRGKS